MLVSHHHHVPFSFLLGVFREGNGIFLEDVDEHIVEQCFHHLIGALECRAGICRWSEVIGQLIYFFEASGICVGSPRPCGLPRILNSN